jgi:AcrR family transcriptional regulator
VPYDPERTRASVFAAGVAEFAAHGLAGARVDRIARNAGVDKKAIYLYFGDKRALFEAVLAHELSRLAEAVPLEPGDLPGYVRRLFDYHRQHPEYLRLMQWEALEFTAGEVPGEPGRSAHYRRRVAALSGEEDPASLWLTLAGMATWAFTVPQLTRMVLGGDATALDSYQEWVVEYARRLAATAEGNADVRPRRAARRR